MYVPKLRPASAIVENSHILLRHYIRIRNNITFFNNFPTKKQHLAKITDLCVTYCFFTEHTGEEDKGAGR